jgi:hypothetical protein
LAFSHGHKLPSKVPTTNIAGTKTTRAIPPWPSLQPLFLYLHSQSRSAMTATIIPTAPPSPPRVMDTRYRHAFLLSDVLVSSMRCNNSASTSAGRPANRTPVFHRGPVGGQPGSVPAATISTAGRSCSKNGVLANFIRLPGGHHGNLPITRLFGKRD